MNFSNMGCHIIKFPTGRFGFVGSIPSSLCTRIPATMSDILGCRSFSQDGQQFVYRAPSFIDEYHARTFARLKGVELAN